MKLYLVEHLKENGQPYAKREMAGCYAVTTWHRRKHYRMAPGFASLAGAEAFLELCGRAYGAQRYRMIVLEEMPCDPT